MDRPTGCKMLHQIWNKNLDTSGTRKNSQEQFKLEQMLALVVSILQQTHTLLRKKQPASMTYFVFSSCWISKGDSFFKSAWEGNVELPTSLKFLRDNSWQQGPMCFSTLLLKSALGIQALDSSVETQPQNFLLCSLVCLLKVKGEPSPNCATTICVAPNLTMGQLQVRNIFANPIFLWMIWAQRNLSC